MGRLTDLGQGDSLSWMAESWLSGHSRAAFLLVALAGCGEAFTSGGDAGGEAGASGEGNGGSSGAASAGKSGASGSGATAASSGAGGTSGSGAEGGEPGAEGGAGNAGASGANEGGMPGTGGSSGIAGTAALAGTAGIAGTAGTGGVVIGPVVPQEGLLLWLRADTGVTVGPDQRVRSWVDQSGNGLDAEQTGGNQQPELVNSGGRMPRIEFDGEDDFLRLPVGFDDFSAGLSAFVVTSARTLDACWAVIELSNGSEIDDIFLGQYSQSVQYEVLNEWVTEGDYPVGEDLVLAVIHDTDHLVETRTNGNFAGDMMASLPAVEQRAENFLGRSQYDSCGYLEGSISEVLLYNRAVSSDELLQIEDYLATRWGCCRD